MTNETGQSETERLQIRLTVDGNMEEYAWLKALPEKVRGREILAEVRFSRRLRAMGGFFAAMGTAPVAAVPLQQAPTADTGARAVTLDLSDEAADRAQSRVDVSFFAAVPPLQ